MVIFGGWSGSFLDDVQVLNFGEHTHDSMRNTNHISTFSHFNCSFSPLDVFKEYYPSRVSQDWAWSEYTASLDLGNRIPARAKHTAVVVGEVIYIYGGLVDWNEDSSNSMYKIDRKSFQ
jgi:hypothetical protein